MSRATTRVSSRIGREMFGVGRVDAVEDRLEVALDDRHRRAELVADVGEQAATLAFVGLEPSHHRVETRGERPRRRKPMSIVGPTRTE